MSSKMILIDEDKLRLALAAMVRINEADNDCDFLNVKQADQLDEAIDVLRDVLTSEQPKHQCVACEGKPSRENNPCTVCGKLALQQEPVAKLTGVDEFGPMLEWYKHWFNVPIGTKFYTKHKKE